MNPVHRRARVGLSEKKPPAHMAGYDISGECHTLNPTIQQTHTNPGMVPVYAHLSSYEVVKWIPLSRFSRLFQQMYGEGIFDKVFYDYGQISAISIHNTIFIPKMGEHF